MTFALPTHISYCSESEGTVVLDLEADRYLALAPKAGEILRKCSLREPLAMSEVKIAEALVQKGILVRGNDYDMIVPYRLPRPKESLIENREPVQFTARHLFDAGLAMTKAWTLQRTCNLAKIIARLRMRKGRLQNRTQFDDDQGLAREAMTFFAARRLLPPRPICLRDSLGLLEYLAPKGFAPDLVFGVVINPFAAHCWVQSKETLLNEALHRASSHRAILVI